MTDTVTAKKSSPILIAIAWAIVVIPTVWGLSYTVQNALKIFVTAPAATSVTPTPAH
jgi:hypothetical protein